jgi:hypothetical protein
MTVIRDSNGRIVRHYVHGEAAGNGTKEYRAWRAMIYRCYYPNNGKWEHYGGRGITVCTRWRKSYPTFLRDVGRAPSPQHSLDRKDNDGDYKPSNVRWATKKEQAQNRRKRRWKKKPLTR